MSDTKLSIYGIPVIVSDALPTDVILLVPRQKARILTDIIAAEKKLAVHTQIFFEKSALPAWKIKNVGAKTDE